VVSTVPGAERSANPFKIGQKLFNGFKKTFGLGEIPWEPADAEIWPYPEDKVYQ
jgi:hypothetical protein